jgi:hypothetical protein
VGCTPSMTRSSNMYLAVSVEMLLLLLL